MSSSPVEQHLGLDYPWVFGPGDMLLIEPWHAAELAAQGIDAQGPTRGQVADRVLRNGGLAIELEAGCRFVEMTIGEASAFHGEDNRVVHHDGVMRLPHEVLIASSAVARMPLYYLRRSLVRVEAGEYRVIVDEAGDDGMGAEVGWLGMAVIGSYMVCIGAMVTMGIKLGGGELPIWEYWRVVGAYVSARVLLAREDERTGGAPLPPLRVTLLRCDSSLTRVHHPEFPTPADR
jgi:hypothetical protein